MGRPSEDTFLEKARWDAFFALDKARGGRIRAKVDEDIEAYRNGTPVTDTEEKLRKLIRHAVRTSDFYKDYDENAPLSSFPLVNKEFFRDHYDEFVSREFKDAKDNRVMHTSGSTGTPFPMVQDRNKIWCNYGDAVFLHLVAGYRIGEKIAWVRTWVKHVRLSPPRAFAENMVMMDTCGLSDQDVHDMVYTLRDQGVKAITGYPSSLRLISNYIEDHKVDMSNCQVHAIIPMSEVMPDDLRAKLQEQFGCPVRSTYSNEENGIMGIEHADDNGYYMNTTSYYFEILKMDSDEPAEEGELGRIVITDLNNYAFPIIRYENGDMAIAHREEKDGRYTLTFDQVYGRRVDMVYSTKGDAVSPYLINNAFTNVPGIHQYQFVQKGLKDYQLKLNGEQEKADVDEMLRRIRPWFGEDANIEVIWVDEISVLNSGKRKFVVNEAPEYLDKIKG